MNYTKKNIYVADDGTTFDTEEEVKAYVKSLKRYEVEFILEGSYWTTVRAKSREEALKLADDYFIEDIDFNVVDVEVKEVED